MNEQRFKGKIVLVTGSGRGIGKAIALRLAREVADLIINFFRNRQPAEETAAQIEAMGVRAYRESEYGRRRPYQTAV